MKYFKIDASYINNPTANSIEVTIPNNLNNLKIVNATLNLLINNTINTSYKVNYSARQESLIKEHWDNVDYIKNITNSRIFINISDELQSVIDIGNNTVLTLNFEGNTTINFDITNSYIDVEYISLEEYQVNSGHQDINLGKSGTANINFSTGKLNINTPLVSTDNNALPLSITANYNSTKNNKLPTINLPNNWSLNTNQFLIKNQTSDDKLSFTYIDENGKNQIIEEKYYYLDENNKKVFVDRKDIFIDMDGSLHYILNNSFSFKNVYIEDICKHAEILSTADVLENFIKSIYQYIYKNKEIKIFINDVQYFCQECSNSNGRYVLDLQNGTNQLEISMVYNKTMGNNPTQSNIPFPQFYNSFFIVSEKTFNGTLTITIKSDEKTIHTSLESPNNIKLSSSLQDIKNSNLINYEPEELKNVRLNIEELNKNIENLKDNIEINKNQLILLSLNKNYIEKQNEYRLQNLDPSQADYEFESYYYKILDKYNLVRLIQEYTGQEVLNFENEENSTQITYDFIDKFLIDYPNFSLAYKDIASIDQQIKSIIKSNEKLSENLKQYDDELKKLKYQQEQYEMQVPVHYLYNDNNIIYGFGKTGDENIFRLVLITDAYENAIYFNYDSLESNKLNSIIDSAEKYITFFYNDDLLSTITDSRDRQVKFVYKDNKLFSIEHVDKTKSYFYYSNDKLISVLNQTGLGTLFEYDDHNKITKVCSLSFLNHVKDGHINIQETANFETLNFSSLNIDSYKIEDETINFKYENYKSTTLSNNKNKSITYLFDKEGRARSIIEHQSSANDKDVVCKVTDYTYQDNNITMKVSPLPYSHNYLSDVVFQQNKQTTQYGYYLGDSICSDSTIPYSYTVNTNYYEMPDTDQAETACVTMSAENLKLINGEISGIEPKEEICSHRSFVVSGWASANSAFVISDEKTQDENGNEIYPDYIKNRKFEIRVQIKYTDIEKPEIFSRTFDWRNTNWQYCALAFTIKDKEVESIQCFVDFAENTGTISFTDLKFEQANFEVSTFDELNRLDKSISSHSNYYTTYAYTGEETHPYMQTIIDKFNEKNAYKITYEYTKGGKLLRTALYNGIVKENVYDDKGMLIKTITYHKDEPSNKIYEEKKLDDKGKETASVNELGDQTSTYEYIDGTGIVNASIDGNGVKTSYGYALDDTLLETSITSNGIANTNTYGYNLDFLTSLTHNDFSVGYDHDWQGRIQQINIADSIYLSKTYGENKETTTLSTGETYRQTYNDDGNALITFYKKNNNETTVLVENIYDTYGNIVVAKDKVENNEHKYYYDKFGNLVKETNTQHNNSISIENTMDASHSNIKKSTITIGDEQFIYEYDRTVGPDYLLNSITLPNSSLQTLSYDKLQRIKGIKTGDFSKHFTYLKNGDHTSNLVSKLQFGIYDVNKDSLTYKYDKNGNIIEIRENGLLLNRYKYDALSRLIREDNAKLAKTSTYSYDAGGNITERIEYGFTLIENLDSQSPSGIFTYSYPTSGWKDQLKEYNGEKFVYDSIGNPTTYRNKTLVWSHGRQLDNFADIAEYKYNASGIRTSKITNGFTTNYYLNGNKILRQKDASNTITFYYSADGITGFHLKNNVVDSDYYYKKNIQNDIIGIYSTNGTQIARYDYDAWGNCTAKYLQDDGSYATIESGYSVTDTTIINRFIAFKNPFRYRSYYYDFETNLYYLNSRYYDPQIGRFINADDISTLDITQIALNGLNLYAYCLNNPVNEIDENGYFIGWLIFSLIIGAIIGGISNTIKAVQNGANGWQALGSFFVGALTGAALAGSLALGIGAGLSAAGIGFSLGISTATAFGLSIGIGAVSKGIEYSLNSAIYGTKWNVREFFSSIINGGIQGTINFGLGYFGGKFGAYDSLAPQKWGLIEKLFIADVLKNPIRNILTLIAWNLGEPIIRLLLVSLPSFLQKLIFNKIFN